MSFLPQVLGRHLDARLAKGFEPIRLGQHEQRYWESLLDSEGQRWPDEDGGGHHNLIGLSWSLVIKLLWQLEKLGALKGTSQLLFCKHPEQHSSHNLRCFALLASFLLMLDAVFFLAFVSGVCWEGALWLCWAAAAGREISCQQDCRWSWVIPNFFPPLPSPFLFLLFSSKEKKEEKG